MSAPKKKVQEEAMNEEQLQIEPEQDEEEQIEQVAAREPEPPEHVRAFSEAVRAHASAPRGQHLEPAKGVHVLYGYNGLLTVRGHVHVHVATHEDVAAMSNQQLYDAVMAAGKRKVV